MGKHCIVEVMLCVDDMLNSFAVYAVYNYNTNYNTDKGRVEMEKKSRKHQEKSAGRGFQAGINNGRNWTDLETEVSAVILSNLIMNTNFSTFPLLPFVFCFS